MSTSPPTPSDRIQASVEAPAIARQASLRYRTGGRYNDQSQRASSVDDDLVRLGRDVAPRRERQGHRHHYTDRRAAFLTSVGRRAVVAAPDRVDLDEDADDLALLEVEMYLRVWRVLHPEADVELATS